MVCRALFGGLVLASFASSAWATYEWGYHGYAINDDDYYGPPVRPHWYPNPSQHSGNRRYYEHPGDSEDEMSERELWELKERAHHQNAWAPPRVHHGLNPRRLPPPHHYPDSPNQWSTSRLLQPIRRPSLRYPEYDHANYYDPSRTHLSVVPHQRHRAQHSRYTYPVRYDGAYLDHYHRPRPPKYHRYQQAFPVHQGSHWQPPWQDEDYTPDAGTDGTMHDPYVVDGYASDGDGLVSYEDTHQAIQPFNRASKQRALRRARSIDVSQASSSQAQEPMGVFVQVERYPPPDSNDNQNCRIIEIDDGDEREDIAAHTTSESANMGGVDGALNEGLIFDSPEQIGSSKATLTQNPFPGPVKRIDSAAKAKLLKTHSDRLRSHQVVDNETTRKLKMFARYALATYLPPNGGNCHLLRGQDIQAKLKVVFRTSNPPLQGFIAVDSKQKHVVVAIRGSTGHDLKTFLYDMHFSKTDWPEVWPGSKVHKGFLSIAKAAMESLTADLAPYLVDSEYKFFFAGHSLGGAVVTLFMVNFIAQYPMVASKCELTTFGQPMVGNYDFAWYLNTLGVKKSRVTHGLDIVPSLAGKAAGYYHFSGELYIDRWTGHTYYCPQDEDTLEDDKDCSKAVKGLSSDTRDHKVFWGISRRTPEAEVKPVRRKSLTKVFGF